MPKSILLTDFLSQPGSILDVRSPSEFLQGHIPGSHSLALFNDEERARIGISYKKQSRADAVELGLSLIQPKIDDLLNEAAKLINQNTNDKGKVLCWRGGMRSGFVARLLELLNYEMVTLQGGYKTFRRSVLKQLDQLFLPSLYVLGGLTGSGKTAILRALQENGEQVIDLEALAKHCGSAFGGIGCDPQPTQEQFENELAWTIRQFDLSKPIWIEDESRLIGRCYLPKMLYESMIQAPLFYVEYPMTGRLKIILNQYGHALKSELLAAVKKIEGRLGGQLAKKIQQFIEQEQTLEAFEQLLGYYDKAYQYQLTKRQVKCFIQIKEAASPFESAQLCLNMSQRLL